MKYPIGTIVITLTQVIANSRTDQPVALAPQSAGVVVDELDDHVFVLFGPQDATTLVHEVSLADRSQYAVITPAQTAAMFEHVFNLNRGLHNVLVALEQKNYALAHTHVLTEKNAVEKLLAEII
jgi:hypothetical protein